MYTLLFINLFTLLVTICPSVAFSDDIEHETNVEKGIIITLANTDKFIWNKQGGGKTVVELSLKNLQTIAVEGELRLILTSINGHIDFKKVKIVVTKPKNTDKITINRSFFVEESLKLDTIKQRWLFTIILPDNSYKKNVLFQIFAIYSQTKPKKNVFSDTLILNNREGG